MPSAGFEPESAPPGISEAREQVDPEVAQLIQQIENMKREGSSTWLNDLVGFWESDPARSPGRDDKVVGTSDRGSWSQRRRRGKEEVRRRLEDVAAPKDLREAVNVLEATARSEIEEKEPYNEEISMSSLQLRDDGNDGAPASPPHYDSALMHRRQHLVNEMLRLPLDLSATSSDGDTDSVDEHQADSISDRTNSDPSSPASVPVVDKQIDFQELTHKFPNDVDIHMATIIENNAGTSSPVLSDTSEHETGRNEKGMWKTLSVAEDSPSYSPLSSPVQSPQKNGDMVTNSGGSARKRKQKKTRRIVILDPECDAEESLGLKSPMKGYQPDMAPQLATPPSSLGRNLSQPFMSTTGTGRSSSSSTVKRSSTALPGMAMRTPLLAKTVEIAGDLGNVNTSHSSSVSDF